VPAARRGVRDSLDCNPSRGSTSYYLCWLPLHITHGKTGVAAAIRFSPRFERGVEGGRQSEFYFVYWSYCSVSGKRLYVCGGRGCCGELLGSCWRLQGVALRGAKG